MAVSPLKARETFWPMHCRDARALLDWSRARRAQNAGLEVETIYLFEADQGGLSEREQRRLGRALYDRGQGVIAIAPNLAGEGVRLVNPRRRRAFDAPDLDDFLSSRQGDPVRHLENQARRSRAAPGRELS